MDEVQRLALVVPPMAGQMSQFNAVVEVVQDGCLVYLRLYIYRENPHTTITAMGVQQMVAQAVVPLKSMPLCSLWTGLFWPMETEQHVLLAEVVVVAAFG